MPTPSASNSSKWLNHTAPAFSNSSGNTYSRIVFESYLRRCPGGDGATSATGNRLRAFRSAHRLCTSQQPRHATTWQLSEATESKLGETPSFDLPDLLYSGIHANAYAKRSARPHARLCKTHQIFSSERWAHRRRVRSRCVLCQRIGKRNLTILRKASAHQDRCLNRHSLHCSFFIFYKKRNQPPLLRQAANKQIVGHAFGISG